MLSLPTELLLHVVAMHFRAAGMHSLVTVGRMLTTCTTVRDSAEALWQKMAELFVLPLQPLLANVPDYNLNTVQSIARELRAVHGGAWWCVFIGRQREADSHADLGNVGACSEHDFVLRVQTCGEASVRWRCTRAAPGERPAKGWVSEPADVERGPNGITLRSKDLSGKRFDPCEYVFELCYNGLVVVLREARVLGEHAAPLHQIAWGVIRIGRMLQPRKTVLPMPAECISQAARAVWCSRPSCTLEWCSARVRR